MANGPYDAPVAREPAPRRERSVGEHIFIWIGWALAAAFWGMTMTTIGGIVRSVMQPSPAPSGGVDAGGVGFVLMDVVGGLVLLGLAMAYAAWRFSHRNRALDPVSEAATAELYNRVERRGGDDLANLPSEEERSRRGFH